MSESPPARPRGERELIRRLRTLLPPAPPGVAGVPFGDDMAALPGDDRWLWTVDMLMDGVDFDSRVHSWGQAGRKAMAVNLSDCAAMAVEPAGALLAVALRNDLSMDDALELVRGVRECGSAFECPIIGGDTNSWDAPTVISVTVVARVPPGQTPARRDGARPGDGIWLSGPVGGSILGRHLTFEPRVRLALEIGRRLRPRAMIDVSDGLALDLSRVLEASGVGAVLDEASLAAATHADAARLAAQDGRSPEEHALQDGEDFELIVVLAPDQDAEARRLGLLPLGTVCEPHGLRLHGRLGPRPVPIQGWEHFQ